MQHLNNCLLWWEIHFFRGNNYSGFIFLLFLWDILVKMNGLDFLIPKMIRFVTIIKIESSVRLRSTLGFSMTTFSQFLPLYFQRHWPPIVFSKTFSLCLSSSFNKHSTTKFMLSFFVWSMIITARVSQLSGNKLRSISVSCNIPT